MNDDDFLRAAEEAVGFLQGVSPLEYWSSRLPSPADTRISDICTLYTSANLAQREVLCSSLNQDASFILGSFAARMAMLSVREQSGTMSLYGLVALIMKMEWPGLSDSREVLMTLSIVYHSAAMLGRAEALFQQAAQYAVRPSSRDIILDYLARTPENKRIEAMGWHVMEGPSGLIYQFGGQPIPEGHL